MRFIQTGEYWLLSAWQKKNLSDDHFRPDCVSPFGVNDYIEKNNDLTSTIMPGERKFLRVVFYFNVIIIISSFFLVDSSMVKSNANLRFL